MDGSLHRLAAMAGSTAIGNVISSGDENEVECHIVQNCGILRHVFIEF